MGKRTTVQIECPHIIDCFPANLKQTTEDEKLGADRIYGIVVPTAWSGTIDNNAGPHARYWSAKL